jgi:hypothetical protein
MKYEVYSRVCTSFQKLHSLQIRRYGIPESILPEIRSTYVLALTPQKYVCNPNKCTKNSMTLSIEARSSMTELKANENKK